VKDEGSGEWEFLCDTALALPLLRDVEVEDVDTVWPGCKQPPDCLQCLWHECCSQPCAICVEVQFGYQHCK
jgi:hypothetical protein